MLNYIILFCSSVCFCLQASHYETLNVTITASTDEIRHAYLKKAKKIHPDKNPHINTTRLFQELSEAYTILKDPVLRRTYDESLTHENTHNAMSCSTYIITQWTTTYLASCLYSDDI